MFPKVEVSECRPAKDLDSGLREIPGLINSPSTELGHALDWCQSKH